MSDRLLKESDVLKAIDKRIEVLSQDPVFIRKNGIIDIMGIKKYILAIPSVERPKGEWINGHHINGVDYKRCDQCFAEIEDSFFGESSFDVNYCPNCGARMKGADDEVLRQL